MTGTERTLPSTAVDLQRLRDIGRSAVGCLTTETGIVWHPANELLGSAQEIEHLRRCLKEADERYRRRHGDLMYADILCTLAGDLTSGREGDNV